MPIQKRKALPPPTTHVHDRTAEDDAKGLRSPILQGQHLDVYHFIQTNPNCTRDDVARGIGLKSSTATARIKELIDEGYVMEPPGMRKRNRSGVRSKCLHVTEQKQGAKPLDRVRINVELHVDSMGRYHARAYVIDGWPEQQNTQRIKQTRITMTAPHPDTYRSKIVDDEVATVSKHETQTHAEDIIDADFFEVVDND